MQQHPCIGCRKAEKITDFIKRQAVGVAHFQQGALVARHAREQTLQAIRQLCCHQQCVRAVAVPLGRRCGPQAAFVKPGRQRVHCLWQAVQRHFPALLAQPHAPLVDDNPRQPGTQAGTPLERGDGAVRFQPCLLHHFLGIVLADHRTGQRDQRPVMAPHQRRERRLVTSFQLHQPGRVFFRPVICGHALPPTAK